MRKIQALLNRMLRRPIISTLLILAVLFVVGTSSRSSDEQAVVDSQASLPVVSLTSAVDYNNENSLSLIGTVRAVSEANVTAERGGRVTAVNVKLGDFVPAGTVIASLENSAEVAGVTQAEGAYEMALANAGQSKVGLEDANNTLLLAKQGAVSTFQNSYATVNRVVRNSIDDFFASPDNRVPGLRINGLGQTETLNNERVSYQFLLDEWQLQSQNITPESDLSTQLKYAKQNVERTISFTESFLTLFSNQGSNSKYGDDELQSFIVSFTALKSELIALNDAIDGTLTRLSNAYNAVEKAKLSADSETLSVANAQVKQALGVLQSARANLAKTVLRTPISGVVNSLSVRTGDYVGGNELVAVIANNDAVEVVTYVSENEKDLFVVGEEVLIDGAHKGVITEIAPAIDPATRKVEVRIASSDYGVTGDTVRITKDLSSKTKNTDEVFVPLEAVKFEAEDGYVFFVENETLVAQPVKLGVVSGASIQVLEGLSVDTLFVSDARGLVAGAKVKIK